MQRIYFRDFHFLYKYLMMMMHFLISYLTVTRLIFTNLSKLHCPHLTHKVFEKSALKYKRVTRCIDKINIPPPNIICLLVDVQYTWSPYKLPLHGLVYVLWTLYTYRHDRYTVSDILVVYTLSYFNTRI